MAWLHTAPSVKDKDTEPRIKTLEDESPFKALPEIENAEDLAHHFSRMGQINQGSMGITPFTWGDVQSYCQQSGVPLSGWESEQIILMSREYAVMSQKSKQKTYPAPYADESKITSWREVLSKGIKDVFGKIT
ncbi:MAG: hypothetical protein CL578_22375 [Alteromonadaceae bacterium]|nr:hypothetical protein [Methylophaga sp.]MBN27774.1 hypothetical protein [Alteromonadaceae bacterium]HAD31522.1 hypothetical protein [Methylophaga sp.]HBX60965.1 hypothetical protein [Methylophaga sp.]HCN99394.1 hypothetical protein [Methylophaga sp.]